MEHDMTQHTDQPKAPEAKPTQADAEMKDMKGMSSADHHAHIAAEFQKRFWISLVLILLILILSPLRSTRVG